MPGRLKWDWQHWVWVSNGSAGVHPLTEERCCPDWSSAIGTKSKLPAKDEASFESTKLLSKIMASVQLSRGDSEAM